MCMLEIPTYKIKKLKIQNEYFIIIEISIIARSSPVLSTCTNFYIAS